ncbi:MAG: polyhydroxyalkanoate synthesis repressor PhaR [Magnetovibrionaceae bacterium]
MTDQAEDKPVVTIKKYANRRLYNTATSSYVTLDHLAQMVKDGTDFVVFDAKSGDDITRQVLTHIIVEEEAKGQNLLPISFLRHLISFYGDSLQGVVPNYLEQSMQAFAKNQEQMREYVQDAYRGLNPFGQLEEMNRQNVAMFERAMKMWSPFANDPNGPFQGPLGGGEMPPASSPGGGAAPAPDSAQEPAANQTIDDLRGKLQEMEQQLNALTSDKKSP